MDSIFAYIRPLLSFAFPFILLHYFSFHFYQLSLWDLVKWWSANFNKVNSAGAYFLGLFFAILMLWFSFSGFMNAIYLGLVGQNQELVYLGHDRDSHAVYYKKDDNNKTPISGYDYQKYNFTFDTLFRSQMFKMDPLMPDALGTKINRFQFIAIIAVTVSILLFTFAAIGIFNAFIHQAYKSILTPAGLPVDGAMLAFDQIIGKYNLSRGWYFGLIPILLLTWMGFVTAMSKNKTSEPLLSLPTYIYAGEVVQAVPVEMSIRYVERRRSHNSTTNNYENIDSGERYVNFEFTSRLPQPVYVATLINTQSHASQLEEIEHNIVQKKPMHVIINEDMSISITTDKDNLDSR